MILKLNQVMLYVNDVRKAQEFWCETLGFKLIETQQLPDGYECIEVAPRDGNETSLVIFDRAFIEKYSPEVSTSVPSLMFKVADVEGLYDDLMQKGVTVGDLVERNDVKIFNFSDFDGNYFAVTE